MYCRSTRFPGSYFASRQNYCDRLRNCPVDLRLEFVLQIACFPLGVESGGTAGEKKVSSVKSASMIGFCNKR